MLCNNSGQSTDIELAVCNCRGDAV